MCRSIPQTSLLAIAAAITSQSGGIGSALAQTLARAITSMQDHEQRELLLAVIINNVDTQKIGNFVEIDGALFATVSELRELGLALSDRFQAGELIKLSTIKGSTIQLDEREQSLRIDLPVDALHMQRLGTTGISEPKPDAVAPGALLNYDMTLTGGHGQVNAFGYGNARLFGSLGVVQSDFNLAYTEGDTRAVRLASTYSYSDPGKLRTVALGDVISGSLAYTRSVRLGGAQLATNFSLRPDLITYPLPSIRGRAAVPSTVDILVDGVSQLSQSVAPGPFYIPQLPVIGGGGEISVSVRDAAGRQTVQTSSFYTASALLRPGLSALSFEIGGIRRNFGLKSNDYRSVAASGTGRLGLSASTTVEGHIEVAPRLVNAVGGATTKIGNLAVVSVAGGAGGGDGQTGLLGYASVERSTRAYHVGASALMATKDYHDIASLAGDPTPDHVIQANAGVTLGNQGSFGIAYTDVDQRVTSATGQRDSLSTTFPDPPSEGRSSLISATYSRELFGRAYAYLTGYQQLSRGRGAVIAGISLRFGRSSASASYGSAGRQATLEATRPVIAPGDIGWRVYTARGVSDRDLGELRYRAGSGEVSLGIDRYAGNLFVQGRVNGGLVLMNGEAFATNKVNDGFAIVDSGGFRDVGVSLNNRPIGRTNSHGVLLVPGLTAYQANKLALDPTDLPLDVEWDRVETSIAPADRSGAIARFGVRRSRQALLAVAMPDGTPIAPGTVFTISGRPDVNVVAGFDGQIFLKDVSGRQVLQALLADGRQCLAIVDLGDTPDIAMNVRNVRCVIGRPQMASRSIIDRAQKGDVVSAR